ETVRSRFDETFGAVAANFEEVAGTLFPGGEGRLRLVEPEEEGGDEGVEVEAALDDTNIARFVELLRAYSDRAQFVVITHQKRTMEAADVLYGVTMGGEGVSQVVSRRLPREEAKLAGAA